MHSLVWFLSNWVTFFRLATLDLGKNSLSGSLPSVLFSKLLKLEVLVLSENAFDGALSAMLCSRSNLHLLNLSSNNLTCPLPKLASLSNVNYSGATFNLSLLGSIRVCVPSSFCYCTIDLQWLTHLHGINSGYEVVKALGQNKVKFKMNFHPAIITNKGRSLYLQIKIGNTLFAIVCDVILYFKTWE